MKGLFQYLRWLIEEWQPCSCLLLACAHDLLLKLQACLKLKAMSMELGVPEGMLGATQPYLPRRFCLCGSRHQMVRVPDLSSTNFGHDFAGTAGALSTHVTSPHRHLRLSQPLESISVQVSEDIENATLSRQISAASTQSSGPRRPTMPWLPATFPGGCSSSSSLRGLNDSSSWASWYLPPFSAGSDNWTQEW